jgi:Peptidase family M23
LHVGPDCVLQNYVDQDGTEGARDYNCGTLTYDGHNGTDIRLRSLAQQRLGIDVLAAANGTVLRTRDGVPDVALRGVLLADIEGKECGNGVVIAHENGFETQYCHLAQHSIRVAPGATVSVGDILGRIGLSGRTEYPHLHFVVRHRGQVVDPFAFEVPPGTCGQDRPLWAEPLRSALAYKASAVLNIGFATGPLTMEMIETGEAGKPRLDRTVPAVVAFGRGIGLKAGDVQRLKITAPDGSELIHTAASPLERDMAQAMVFAGKRRPSAGWAAGTYVATYEVDRSGSTALSETFSVEVVP